MGNIEELKQKQKEIISLMQREDKHKPEVLKEMIALNRSISDDLKKILQNGTPEEKKQAFDFFTTSVKFFLEQTQKLPGAKENIDAALQKLSPEQQKMAEQVKESMKSLQTDLSKILGL